MRGTRTSFLRSGAAWIGLFVLYIATANVVSATPDTWAASLAAYTIATTGSPDVSPFHQADATRWLFEVDGRLVTNRFAGAVLYAVPFYALAAPFTVTFSLWPGAAAAAAAAATSVLFLYHALRTVQSASIALGTSALYGLGSATWAVSADAQWSHGAALVALTYALFAVARGQLGLTGFSLGLAATARPHLAVAVPIVGLWLAVSRRSWRPLWLVSVGAAPAVLLLVAYNGWVHGKWSPVNGLEVAAAPDGSLGAVSGLSHLPENLVGFLVSPGRGVFVLYPVLIVLLPGIVAAWRRCLDWEKSAAVAGLGYTVVQLLLNRYSGGGWFFGSRLSIEGLTLMMPLLVQAWIEVYERMVLRRLALLMLGWTAVTHAFGAILPPPCSIGECPPSMGSPWTFYDPWILASQLGWLPSAALLLALTGILVLTLRATRTQADARSTMN